MTDDTPDLFSHYPDAPGYRAPGPSQDAAASMRMPLSYLRRLVLDLLARHPAGLSVHEAAKKLKLPIPSIQPRFSELRQVGAIEDTGERRQNVTGRTASVWRKTRV